MTARLHPGFRQVMRYTINGWMPKEVVLFLGEAIGETSLQASEIEQSRWVSIQEARILLHPDYRPSLRETEEILCGRSSF